MFIVHLAVKVFIIPSSTYISNKLYISNTDFFFNRIKFSSQNKMLSLQALCRDNSKWQQFFVKGFTGLYNYLLEC